MKKPPFVVARTTSVLLLFTFATTLSSFNSQEHKIIGDVGVNRVMFPTSLNFPSGIGFLNSNPAQYVSYWQAAKMLAVGFATNNPNDYDRYKKGVQDNCYWTGFGQLEYNKNNYIEATSRTPQRPLLFVTNTVGSQQQQYTFGDLIALYGDYRRTVTCENGNCFMSDSANNDNMFSKGNYTDYCPPTISVYQYQKSIAYGLVPPFGSFGNVSGNTAGERQFNEAGWWGDEMMRLANVNETHFSNVAIAWYIGMHRLALVALKKAITEPVYWSQAINYETSALHALTDLFAFGHVVTNRDQSSYGAMKNKNLLNEPQYLWMENVVRMGGGNRNTGPADNYPGKVTLSGSLPSLSFVENRNRSDYMPSYLGNWITWAQGEHTYHNYFNSKGARVRNFNGDVFQVYGDGMLHKLDDRSRRVIENAVTASAQTLVDAYVKLKKGEEVEAIARAGSVYFNALKYIPVFIEADPDTYFTGMWTLYAGAVRTVAGAGNMPSGWENCRIPFLSGADWGWPNKQPRPCTRFQ